MTENSRIDRPERRFDGDIGREAPLRGVRTLTAILPNGRTVWLRVAPPIAPAVGLRRVADDTEHAARWRRAATRWNCEGITRLGQQLVRDAERLTEARLVRVEALRRRMVARHNKTDRRLAKASGEFRANLAKQIEIERETIRRLRRRDLWDKIVIATSLPLFAAFGQRGRPFGGNNLALLISLLIWLVGDEIGDALFGSADKSPYPMRDTDAWSYIAPLGNLLAGWWLMSGLQHERFVAGFTRDLVREEVPLPAGGGDLRHIYIGEVDLSEVIAARHFEDFRSFSDVPAVATIRAIGFTAASARIESVGATANTERLGFLTVRVTILAADPGVVPVPSVVDALEIAWMVDTQNPEVS